MYCQVTVKGSVNLKGVSSEKPSVAHLWINVTQVQIDDDQSTAVAEDPIITPGDKNGLSLDGKQLYILI